MFQINLLHTRNYQTIHCWARSNSAHNLKLISVTQNPGTSNANKFYLIIAPDSIRPQPGQPRPTAFPIYIIPFIHSQNGSQEGSRGLNNGTHAPSSEAGTWPELQLAPIRTRSKLLSNRSKAPPDKTSSTSESITQLVQRRWLSGWIVISGWKAWSKYKARWWTLQSDTGGVYRFGTVGDQLVRTNYAISLSILVCMSAF